MTIGADDPEELNPRPLDERSAIQEAEFDSDLIAHMVRCWDAEREIAQRLAAKVTTILSALALLFGLGLFKIDWTIDPKHITRIRWVWAEWFIRLALCASLLCFGQGLRLGIRGISTSAFRRGKMRPATDLLRLSDELIRCPPLSDKESRAVSFYHLSKAIDELSKQNAEKATRVQLCESWFIRGMCLVLLATLTYILFSVAPSSVG